MVGSRGGGPGERAGRFEYVRRVPDMHLSRAAVDRLPPRAAPLRAVFVCLALLLIGAGSPLAAFDALVPAEPGVTIAGRDIPYGPDPRQRLDVYAPDPPRPGAPVVLFIYGGVLEQRR